MRQPQRVRLTDWRTSEQSIWSGQQIRVSSIAHEMHLWRPLSTNPHSSLFNSPHLQLSRELSSARTPLNSDRTSTVFASARCWQEHPEQKWKTLERVTDLTLVLLPTAPRLQHLHWYAPPDLNSSTSVRSDHRTSTCSHNSRLLMPLVQRKK